MPFMPRWNPVGSVFGTDGRGRPQDGAAVGWLPLRRKVQRGDGGLSSTPTDRSLTTPESQGCSCTHDSCRSSCSPASPELRQRNLPPGSLAKSKEEWHIAAAGDVAAVQKTAANPLQGQSQIATEPRSAGAETSQAVAASEGSRFAAPPPHRHLCLMRPSKRLQAESEAQRLRLANEALLEELAALRTKADALEGVQLELAAARRQMELLRQRNSDLQQEVDALEAEVAEAQEGREYLADYIAGELKVISALQSAEVDHQREDNRRLAKRLAKAEAELERALEEARQYRENAGKRPETGNRKTERIPGKLPDRTPGAGRKPSGALTINYGRHVQRRAERSRIRARADPGPGRPPSPRHPACRAKESRLKEHIHAKSRWKPR